MIFYENKKNFKFVTLFFLVSTYLVFLLKPYYYVTFDSEPDYLANSFHILNWSIPWGGHHPGTIIQYFYSQILKITIFLNLDLKYTIIVLRVVYFSIYLLLIYLSSQVLNEKKFFFKYILILSIIFPVINFHFSHFGVELILFGLSLLIWSLFYKQTYIKQSENKNEIIACLLGIVVSIKLSSIILVLIYFFILFFLIKNTLKSKLYLIFKTSLISLTIFVIFTLPSARYYPKLFNKIKRQFSFDLLSTNEILNYFFIVLLIIIFLICCYFHNQLSKLISKNKNLFLSIFIFFLTILLILSIYRIDFEIGLLNAYFSIPSTLRNFLPLVPFYFIFFYHKKINLNFFSIIIFSILNIFLCYSHFYKKVPIIDHLIEKNRNEKIVVYSDSTFNSKYYFLEFTKVRWGNNKLIFPKNWNDKIDLTLLSNDVYQLWINKIRELNTQSNKNKPNSENNFMTKLRKLFSTKEYGEERFNLISLTKPPYNSRILFDHCDYFKENTVMFDLNYSDKRNQIYYESTIEDVQKYCNIKLISKKNKNNIIIYKYE